MAVAALVVATTAAAAQYGPAEPIGQGGRPVATPQYSPRDRNSPTHVGPIGTQPYRVIVRPSGNQSKGKR